MSAATEVKKTVSLEIVIFWSANAFAVVKWMFYVMARFERKEIGNWKHPNMVVKRPSSG